MLRRLSRWKREAIFLAAGLVIGAGCATGVALALTSEDEPASVRPAAARTTTLRVIPPPQKANGKPALPNSSVCSIGGKCRNFSWAETADMATSFDKSAVAVLNTWGGTGAELIFSLAALAPQVQAAAISYVAARYCITLRFPFPQNAYYITANPYGPRGRNGC